MDKQPKSKKQDEAIGAKEGKLQSAAANGDSAASVAHDSPDPDANDQDNALHGAKLLSAIANAHVNHLQQMSAPKAKGKAE